MSCKKKEIWKDIPGYEGLYRASSLGRIFSYAKTWKSGRWLTRTLPDRELSCFILESGYVVVGLRKNRVQKNKYVHRLIAITFISNPANKEEVNHKDTNKLNNCVSNLEWATPTENMQHAHNNDLMNLPKGEKHHKSKLKPNDIRHIRRRLMMQKDYANKYNVAVGTIQNIQYGRTWKHLL